MKTFSFIIVFVLTTFASMSQGIRFFEGDWQGVLAEAKKTKKIIFVDVYTTWCGPCKIMEKKTFTDLDVGKFFNDKFICYKMDAEKGFGTVVAQRFNVTSYPTCIYLDASENLLYKQEGLMQANDMLKEGEMVVRNSNDTKPKHVLDKQYTDGNRDPEFLLEYIVKKSSYNEDNSIIVDEYVAQLTPIQQSSEKTLRLIVNNGFQLDGPAYNVLLKFREKAESLFEEGNRKVDGIFANVINQSFATAIQKKDEALFEKTARLNLTTRKNSGDANRVNDKNRLTFCIQKKDRNDPTKLIKASEQYLDNYVMLMQTESIRMSDEVEYQKLMKNYRDGYLDSTGTREFQYRELKRTGRTKTAKTTADEFNIVIKTYLEMVTDVDALQRAIPWGERAIELIQEPDSIHTFALLYLKIGNKDKSIELEKLAAEIAQRENLDTAKYLAAIEKLK